MVVKLDNNGRLQSILQVTKSKTGLAMRTTVPQVIIGRLGLREGDMYVIEWPRIFSDSEKDITVPDRLKNDMEGLSRLRGLLIMMRRRIVERRNTLVFGNVELTEAQIAEAGGSREIAESEAMLERTDLRSNNLKSLMVSRVKMDPMWCIPKAIFYRDVYVPWCRSRGVKPWSAKAVTEVIREEYESDKEYLPYMQSTVRVWYSMKVLDEDGERVPGCVQNPKYEALPQLKPADQAPVGCSGKCECGHADAAVCILHECACCISKNESGMQVHQQQQQRYEVEGASGGLSPAGTSGGGGGDNPK